MDIDELAYECQKIIDSGDVKKISDFTSLVKDYIKPEQTVDNVVCCYYFLGNLYSALSFLLQESASSWRNSIFPSNRVCSINAYRLAERMADEIRSPLIYEIQTNLANEIAHQRRNFESIEKWRCDFNIVGDTPFVSSLSKARELLWIRHWLNDDGHSNCYVFAAYIVLSNLRSNLRRTDHPNIIETMNNDEEILSILDYGDKNREIIINWDKEKYTEYASTDEKRYREWCLKSRLFVNPLNDITDQCIADQDILQFPNHKVEVGAGPFFSAAFSSLKREYCFARFLAYEGFHGIHPKYEHRNLYLTNTLDGVRYDGSVEKIKTAFRVCFGILDSLSALINRYFKCNHQQPAFTSKWIRENLASYDNFFIDALYWLACDLTDTQAISSDKWKAPYPSAAKIRRLRNAIEHGWLRVTDSDSPTRPNNNDYASTVSANELKENTLFVLKIVRSALIYFCLAVKFHESKANEEQPTGIYVPQFTPLVDDDFI